MKTLGQIREQLIKLKSEKADELNNYGTILYNEEKILTINGAIEAITWVLNESP